MAQSKTQKIIKDTNGNEVVMERVDKTLKEIMEEQPSSILSADFWHPKYDQFIEEVENSNIDFDRLKNIFFDQSWLISTDHVRASEGEKEGDEYPIEYYSTAGLKFTGYDTSKIPHCTKNAFKRMKRAMPQKGDVLLGGFGMGPTGKSVVIWHEPAKEAIVGNIFVLRLGKQYSANVLDVFLKSHYGQAQIERYKTGVALNKLSNPIIEYFLVPKFNKSVIENIEIKYKEMFEFHDKAMQAKKVGNEAEHKKYLEKAQKMLKDLIARTEAVIRGERDDVI